ncbi:MAG: cation-translocating P-type ATPase [Lachnospiraceae bacterium]|nr:cation-translocating P-type ATPase [Lachnospiraceae bacterium]
MATERKGLTSQEVADLQAKYGKNEFTQGKKKSIFKTIFEQFTSPLIILLIIASVISFFTGEIVDGVIIIVVVIINAIIGTAQEVSAEKSVEKLKKMSVATAVVIRDDKQIEIPSTELVVGDYCILEAGRIVPADMHLTECSSLKINESALTGESVAAEKDLSKVSDEKTPLGDRTDCCFMSTLIEYGRGEGVVTSIGDHTEIGKISKMLNDIEKDETPLQKNLNKISMVLGLAGIVLCIVMFATEMLLYKGELIPTLMISIAFAVAVIPEGLATVVTLVLSMGIKKMSERNAIVKQIHAVETLGAVNVICSDKTGTLTQNRMTIVKWFLRGQVMEADEPKMNDGLFNMLLRGFVACNDATYDIKEGTGTGDPTEIAFIKYALEKNLDMKVLREQMKRIDEIPFDSDRKMMTVLEADADGDPSNNTSFTKGAIDSIIVRCDRILTDEGVRPITNQDIYLITKTAEEMSSNALRVLALSYRVGDTVPQEEKMIFLGLGAMIDPPKEGVRETIDQCHHAGIDVAMITGDHKITAFAIAKELNIAESLEQCISGAEIDEMDPEEFKKNILNYRVFARVSPQHKVQIVQAFRAHDKICSMTGDGVNDAPSLKAANIGVSMGIGGTEVAKDAAEMILVDDNFITIKNAVMEGRNLFNNIKKSVIYLLRANFGEVVLMASAIFGGLASPLTTIQILWVNLLTDTFPSLALGMDPGTDDVMNEQPRDVNKGLLNKSDYISIVVQGLICGLTALFAFILPALYGHGITGFAKAMLENSEEGAALLNLCRTYCFTTLVFNELLMVYVCKNLRAKHLLSKDMFNNMILNLSVLFGFLIQILALVVPPLRNLLKLAEVGVKDILIMLLVAAVGMIINFMISVWKTRLEFKN